MGGVDVVVSGCGEKLHSRLIGRVVHCGSTNGVAVTFEACVFGIIKGG